MMKIIPIEGLRTESISIEVDSRLEGGWIGKSEIYKL
jgi:hypothetical protein